jgi:hypothetical protein
MGEGKCIALTRTNAIITHDKASNQLEFEDLPNFQILNIYPYVAVVEGSSVLSLYSCIEQGESYRLDIKDCKKAHF